MRQVNPELSLWRDDELPYKVAVAGLIMLLQMLKYLIFLFKEFKFMFVYEPPIRYQIIRYVWLVILVRRMLPPVKFDVIGPYNSAFQALFRKFPHCALAFFFRFQTYPLLLF